MKSCCFQGFAKHSNSRICLGETQDEKRIRFFYVVFSFNMFHIASTKQFYFMFSFWWKSKNTFLVGVSHSVGISPDHWSCIILIKNRRIILVLKTNDSYFVFLPCSEISCNVLIHTSWQKLFPRSKTYTNKMLGSHSDFKFRAISTNRN